LKGVENMGLKKITTLREMKSGSLVTTVPKIINAILDEKMSSNDFVEWNITNDKTIIVSIVKSKKELVDNEVGKRASKPASPKYNESGSNQE